MQVNTIITGDCLEVMKDWPDNSVDAIVTDPPYGLEFMGKGWDKVLPNPKIWTECLRIAKPGVFLLCFGGTRTYHRITCGLEDASWEIRDCMMWLYGSGFPKSHNISKAIDKAAGAERKIVGQKWAEKYPNGPGGVGFHGGPGEYTQIGRGPEMETIPATDLAQLWDGYGTALKPAWEPIIIAMKPLDGTFAHNAETHRVAGLNIDGGRIGVDLEKDKSQLRTMNRSKKDEKNGWGMNQNSADKPQVVQAQGRWPANVILDEEAAAMLDEQSGDKKSGFMAAGTKRLMSSNPNKNTYGKFNPDTVRNDTYGDFGGVSRFFYCAKASRSERNTGLAGMEEKRPDNRTDTGKGIWAEKGTAKQTNHHPTVKPLKLMEYLCTLLKPPHRGILLDPFCGSGTTLMAACKTGWDYIGIDKEAEYVEITKRRVAWCKKSRNKANDCYLFPVER